MKGHEPVRSEGWGAAQTPMDEMPRTRARYVVVGSLAALALAAVVLVAQYGASPPATGRGSELVQYRESVVSLPGFDPLYADVYGNNCDPGPVYGCFLGGSNYSQVPVLANSPEQPPGVYYVDNSSNLIDEYDDGARVVAHVAVFGQKYAEYGGMTANEFFLSYGYDVALFYGANNRGDVGIEVVNLTTGNIQTVETNIATAPPNQQVFYAGGSTAYVVSGGACTGADCPGKVVGVNVSSGANWTAAELPYFEANNIYWIPQERKLLDIAAEGSLYDVLSEWNQTATGDLVESAAATYDWNIEMDWVDGLAFNGTAVAFSAGGGLFSTTYVLQCPNGLVTTVGEVKYHVANALNGTISPQLISGQQYVYTSDWVVGGRLGGTQYLFDPWNGTVIPTNEAFTNLSGFTVCDGSCFLGQQATGVGTLIDFHASVARNDPFWSVVVATLASGLPS